MTTIYRNMESSKTKNSTPNGINDCPIDLNIQCRTYHRRWLILALFCLCSACNASHWIQYSIITNIVAKFYGVSNIAIDWTSIVFMAAYIPLVFPASWVLQKKGLRVAVVLGSFLLALGSWVKVFSAQPNRFVIAFIGQTVVGISQMFTLGAPARLAAVWFPHHQVSTATAIGVFGNQVGIAIGFLVPPLVVKEGSSEFQVGQDLYTLHVGTALAATIIFCFIALLFQASPPVPPSVAQKLVIVKGNRVNEKSFYHSLKVLMRNIDFTLLLGSYGMNIGAFYAYSTLLNQLIISHFREGVKHAGTIGLILIIGGVIGSLVWGIVLDKTQIYKGTTLTIYLLSMLGMAAFAFSLEQELMPCIYLTSAFLGFFMNGYLTVGYEFGAELTYPESESTSSGLLNASGELCGVLAVTIGEVILNQYSTLVLSFSLVIMLLLGLILCLFIDGNKLQRLAASKQSNTNDPLI